MRKIAQFLTAVALGVAALGAQAQIVTNGSFEANSRADGTSGAIVWTDAWAHTGAETPTIVNPVGLGGGSGFGEQFAQLVRPGYANYDSEIRQTLSLAAGSYSLSFMALGNGAMNLGSLTYAPNSLTPVLFSVLNSPSWSLYSFTVNVSAPSDYRLAFSTSSSLSVDNVSVSAVTAVPEPETYAMMLAGLGAIGFLSRRRKQAA